MQKLLTLVHPGGYSQMVAGWDKNYLLNPSFQISQPITASFSVAASTVPVSRYNVDQWATSFDPNGGTTAAIVTSRQLFTLGQGVVQREPTHFLRIQNTTVGASLGANSYHFLLQPIEGVRTLAGETVTLSFWAQSSIASKVIGVYFQQYFGTGGSPSATIRVAGGNVVLGAGWQKYTLTVTLPSISGKIIGSNSNDHLSLIFVLQGGAAFIDPVCQTSGGVAWGGTGTIDLANVQLELGSTDTDFINRPIDMELLRCRRYYFFQGSNQFVWTGLGVAFAAGTNFFPTPMRVSPTVQFFTDAAGSPGLTDRLAATTITGFSVSQGGTHGVTELYSSSGSFAKGSLYYAFMEASARL